MTKPIRSARVRFYCLNPSRSTVEGDSFLADLRLGCRKGKRECLYPDPPAAKGASSQSSKDGSGPSQQTSPSSSRDDDDDEMDQDAKLEPILDEDEGQGRGNTRQRPIPNIPPRRASTTSFSRHLITSDPRQGSETPSQEGTKSSSSPSVSAGATSGLTPAALQSADFPLHAAGARPDWTFLPQELQFYLGHFYENITHYHYCMVSDAGDFFRSILPSIAIRDEALLYAIVGFSAYHHTLKNPAGQIKEFLQYYNRSVTLLLGFLKRREKHNIGTLLTILQLATIEVGYPNQLDPSSSYFFLFLFFAGILTLKRRNI